MIGYDPYGMGSDGLDNDSDGQTDETDEEVGISTATADTLSFSFVADADGRDNDSDGIIDETYERETIVYALDVGQCQLTRNGQALAENIETLIFTYDATITSDMRLITVEVTSKNSDATLEFCGAEGCRALTFTSNIRPRNI